MELFFFSPEISRLYKQMKNMYKNSFEYVN